MRNGRCRLHGGKSLSGLASGTFKHGRYSKHLPINLAASFQEALADPELLDLSAEIALTDTRLGEVLKKLGSGESTALWGECRSLTKDLKAALKKGDGDAIQVLLSELMATIEKGATEAQQWREIIGLMDTRRKLTESETKRKQAMQQYIDLQQFMGLVQTIASSLKRHVTDRPTLSAVTEDLRRVLGTINAKESDQIPPEDR